MLPNPQEAADFVTFTEEALNGKLHFLCSDRYVHIWEILLLHQKLMKIYRYTSYWDHRGLFAIGLTFPRSILEPRNGLKLFSVGWDTKCQTFNLLNNSKSKVKNGVKEAYKNLIEL